MKDTMEQIRRLVCDAEFPVRIRLGSALYDSFSQPPPSGYQIGEFEDGRRKGPLYLWGVLAEPDDTLGAHVIVVEEDPKAAEHRERTRRILAGEPLE